jgi:hypothetical protein
VRQILGEAERRPAARRPHQAHLLPRDAPRANGALGVFLHAPVRQHEVQRVRLQAREQFTHRAGVQHQLHSFAPEQRRQKTALEVPRQCCHGPDAQHLPLLTAPFTQRRHQLRTGLHDRVGVRERNPTGLGQHQRTPLPHEERLPEPRLQLPDLRRER